ncbi:Stp1/IreP family PP2C-type Ser/Thr phosphatase [Noviherbaspirillum aridicola]|uniref:Protein phosphatase n=1 Tax=Noviherbaspirillum aridicola TaxID=2849687 RepID=A0ABQ4Q934_9BURK|nr:Stp1/IreP family PP2C-type Ser/Thr phosphatase [Noviherbaspirillum aridicola]GIZ53209.1 protein phosphatase [Noviherbaspirillum aridicola]
MQLTPNLEFASRTDPGLVRAQNEDALAYSPDYAYAILADGMGGYNAGEIASGMAVAVMVDELDEQLARDDADASQALASAVRLANEEVFCAAQSRPDYRGMGTTLVAAVFRPGRVTVAHVGDSRLYRLRRQSLVRLTSDHSVVQEQIKAGMLDEQAAAASPERHLLTRALGVEPQVEVDVHEHGVQPDDLYLLCSDGLTDMLADAEIAALLAAHGATPDPACERLVEAANERGGLDNISVLLVRIPPGEPGEEGLFSRIYRQMRRSI